MSKSSYVTNSARSHNAMKGRCVREPTQAEYLIATWKERRKAARIQAKIEREARLGLRKFSFESQ